MSASVEDLHRLTLAFDSLREDDDQMPIQQARLFLAIALRPGRTFEELEREVGLSRAAVWRAIGKMSKWFKVGQAGTDLVETIADPTNPRRQIIFLTPKGNRRISKTLSALTGRSVDFVTPRAHDHVERVHRDRLNETA